MSTATLPPQQEVPELLTVKETAEYLRIPLPTVYYLVQRGQLPAIQIGGRWRIKRSLLDRDILKQEAESQTSALIIESDPAYQTCCKQFFRKAGFARIAVPTGAEALTMLERQPFNFAIMSMKLPDIQGEELYEQIKEAYPDMPIIVITGYPDGEALSRILNHGPVTILRKPLEFDALNKAVQTLGHKGLTD